MTKSEFFVNTLKLQIKSVLRQDPYLADNVNGLILRVWQENGLKLKRKQIVPGYMLPEIKEILAIVKDIEADEADTAKLRIPKLPKRDVEGMEYLSVSTEPKPKKFKKKAK